MSHTIAQLQTLLGALATLLSKPTEAGFSLAPALELVGAHFSATGGMLLKAEDHANLRLAASFGEVWEEETLSPEFLEVTYAALFKYHKPTLVEPGEVGYPGSLIGVPLKAGERDIGGIFLLRAAGEPSFTFRTSTPRATDKLSFFASAGVTVTPSTPSFDSSNCSAAMPCSSMLRASRSSFPRIA